MKKNIVALLLLCSYSAYAKDLTLTMYDDRIYKIYQDDQLPGLLPGTLSSISDTYYYYNPATKQLTVSQTNWYAVGNGSSEEYPGEESVHMHYYDVTFDNMCQMLGYCDDYLRQKIHEMRVEYENYNATESYPKDYTDRQIDSVRKELSAGIASVAAMSSIATSNVSKGEVSVGSGYGYYNGQSAVAFGATVGLTDRWSANAAAGLADSNVSFRAGTNYKFKLF